MNGRTFVKLLLVLAVLAVAAWGLLAWAGPLSSTPAAPATPAKPDVTMSCAVTMGPEVTVTMRTKVFVPATGISVRVMEFGPHGTQDGTNTITFSGPFAAGQTFRARPWGMVTDPMDTTCQIASVKADVPLTYRNLSPVGGAS